MGLDHSVPLVNVCNVLDSKSHCGNILGVIYYILFLKIQCPSDKLHGMLPSVRENVRNNRNSLKFPLPNTHTNRYKNSFLPYVVYNCQ